MLIKKIVPMYFYNFLITLRITYEELCIKFSSILIALKKFYRHLKKILKFKSRKENANLNNW
ncbi:hypothetical protein FWK35_00033769 [Aphis craccivora]|uniref:Uncharacterized protein n=1 Tax=Aphis craccivora TaxID=307492 RepID=A0A6G0VRP5_APHCR|nr:hypothetical protein FWK35_00033769 [Aphis craccivora]